MLFIKENGGVYYQDENSAHNRIKLHYLSVSRLCLYTAQGHTHRNLFFHPLASATTPSETIQPLNHINCNLILQITAWSVGCVIIRLLSIYYTKRIVFSRELKHKSRTLPLLALKELKIGLGKDTAEYSVCISDNKWQFQKEWYSPVSTIGFHSWKRTLRARKLHVKCDLAGSWKMAGI